MTPTLGLGIVGAGRFAGFLAAAVADLPGLQLRAVADPDRQRAESLAAGYDATASSEWTTLLTDDRVDVLAVTTPPDRHAEVTQAALAAGRHVLCEKPLATDLAAARSVAAAAEASGRVLVVDHVLRYNPLLQALVRLQDELLGPVQRFSFENDASDEDLPAGHWFWDADASGGIFLEHGVHFFDAAHWLLGSTPELVAAVSADRADGTTDLVSATALHSGGALATHTHGFTHADRCERQTLRLDHGSAEVRVEGWIPLRARVEAWTDDVGAEMAYSLPSRADELMHVPGHRLGPGSGVTAVVHREAGPARARGRGRDLDLPHRVVLELVLGDDGSKQRVYAESVRAAAADLLSAAAGGPPPRSGPAQALAAVAVADAARRSAAEGRHVRLDQIITLDQSDDVRTA
ncbi:MAG: Gfo/Idh/MocA family oxidoreductase [Sporichthyaceae bacterium]